MHQGDISSAQKIQSAIAVIRAGYFDHHKKQHFYLAPETQRYAALAIGLPLIDVYHGRPWFFSSLVHAMNSEGGNLVTSEQREMFTGNLSKYMREGRPSQRLSAAKKISFFCQPCSQEESGIQKEMAEVSFGLLSASFLSVKEQADAAKSILSHHCFGAAPEEMQQAAIKKLLALMVLPDFLPCQISGCVSSILNARNSCGHLLVSTPEISLIMHYGMKVLNNSSGNHNDHHKFWLAQDLLRADYPELTIEQFSVIVQNVLSLPVQGEEYLSYLFKIDSYKSRGCTR